MARRARATGGRKLHLEPMHTLDVTLRERAGASLLTLSTATIAVARPRLIGSLERMQAAGTALRWVRQAVPARTPEPQVWRVLVGLLTDLDEPALRAPPLALLVSAGLELLAALGYRLDLERCVTCGRSCPAGRPAYIDAMRGGLVCRRCGGAGQVVSAALRERLERTSREGLALEAEDLPFAIDLVEAALLAHANVR